MRECGRLVSHAGQCRATGPCGRNLGRGNDRKIGIPSESFIAGCGLRSSSGRVRYDLCTACRKTRTMEKDWQNTSRQNDAGSRASVSRQPDSGCAVSAQPVSAQPASAQPVSAQPASAQPASAQSSSAQPDTASRPETHPGKAMRIPVITQNVPKDDRRIEPSAAGEAPSRQQLEQDVMATNPSVESMDSRG